MGNENGGGRTVDLVLDLPAGAQRRARDGVPREDRPGDDAEGVPREVDERRVGVPQRLPPRGVGQRSRYVLLELVERERRRASAGLLGAAKVQRIGDEGDAE